jgi:hypothetical protein
MLDSLVLIGAGMLILGIVALLNPVLVGWKSRRDAVIVLAVAATFLTAGWLARFL